MTYFLTTSGTIYHNVWSLIRVPPNHDDKSSDGNARYLLAEGTKKSTNPQSPMKKRNDAADKNGCEGSFTDRVQASRRAEELSSHVVAGSVGGFNRAQLAVDQTDDVDYSLFSIAYIIPPVKKDGDD